MTYKKITILSIGSLLIAGITYIVSTHNVTILPKPTGEYAVGFTAYQLIDTSRPESQVEHGNAHRELMINVWYPAQQTSDEKRLYASPLSLPVLKEGFSMLSKQSEVSAEQFSIEHFAYVDSLRSHAVSNAPIAQKQASYPVLVFAPGFGATCQLYSSLLEEIASHGYIIVGINFPHISNPVEFPDGRVVKADIVYREPAEMRAYKDLQYPTLLDDITFVIGQLEIINNNAQHFLYHKLDLQKVGMLGHSFGGTATIGICQTDTRIKVGVDMDGKLNVWNLGKPLIVPCVFLIALHPADMTDPIKKLSQDATVAGQYIELNEMHHGSFGDYYFFVKPNPALNLHPHKDIELIRALLLKILGEYLA